MILQFFQLSGSCLAIQLSHERPSKQSAIKLNVKKTANINIQQKIINFIFCLDLLNDTASYKVVFSSFRIFVLARPCVTFG